MPYIVETRSGISSTQHPWKYPYLHMALHQRGFYPYLNAYFLHVKDRFAKAEFRENKILPSEIQQRSVETLANLCCMVTAKVMTLSPH